MTGIIQDLFQSVSIDKITFLSYDMTHSSTYEK